MNSTQTSWKYATKNIWTIPDQDLVELYKLDARQYLYIIEKQLYQWIKILQEIITYDS